MANVHFDVFAIIIQNYEHDFSYLIRTHSM